jgi:hypothetical protein
MVVLYGWEIAISHEEKNIILLRMSVPQRAEKERASQHNDKI